MRSTEAGAPTDAEILIAIAGGGRTGYLARRLGVTTAAMRRRLLRMEAAGQVARCDRYTYPNDIYWLKHGRL